MQLLESPIPPLTAAALRIIICKRPAPPDDHLQDAGTSGSSFAWGRPPLDDLFQVASPSGSSFACRHLRMTICKMLVPPYHHLQETSPSFWQQRKGHEKCIFEALYNEIKCALSVKKSNFSEKIKSFTFFFHICLRSGLRWLTPPPPLTVSLTVKYPLFLYKMQ